MPRSQDEHFAASEADNWFTRNLEALAAFDAGADLPLRLLEMYAIRPSRVLEVGAANGYRVAHIGKEHGAQAVAVELSEAAIADGVARYPQVSFVRAPAAQIPLDGDFDLVIVNFVLHWIDRATLLRSVAEIDRLCADGGHLLIGDFLPARATRVPYHHVGDDSIATFKQDYAAVFLASGLYAPVAMLSGDHAGRDLRADVPEADRIGVWLLRRTGAAGYAAGSVKDPA